MASIAKLVVTLGANVAGFETDMERAGRNQRKRMRDMEKAAARMGKAVAAGFAVVSGAMVLAVKSAAEFEAAMAEVSTLMDDTSNMNGLADAVKDIAIQFGKMPVDQAKALYQIISAGASDAATQMEQLTVANKLAVGGVTDVATAADGLTTVLNAYAGSGMSANDVSDILFATMKGGKTTIGELSQSIGNVATIAAQTGVGFDELGAAVGTLTKAGINTSQSMDALRGVLSAVLKQSDQSVKMAKELGVEFNATALEAKGLRNFLADIANTGATSEQLSKLFGRVEGLNAVMALGSQGGAEFTRQLEMMRKSAGLTDEAVAKMSESLKFKAGQAAAAFEVLRIELGEALLASIGELAQYFVDNMDTMRDYAQRFGKAVAKMTKVVVDNIDDIIFAVKTLAELLVLRIGLQGVGAMLALAAGTTTLASSMAFLGGPVGAVVVAMTALLVALDRYQQKQIDAVRVTEVSTEMLLKQAAAYREVSDAAGLAALQTGIEEKRKQLLKEVVALEREIAEVEKEKTKFINSAALQQKVLNARLEELNMHLVNAKRNLKAYNEEAEQTVTSTNLFAAGIEMMNEGMVAGMRYLKSMAKSADDTGKGLKTSATSANLFAASIKMMNDATKEGIAKLKEMQQAQEEYERSVQDILDAIDPTAAAVREFEEAVAEAQYAMFQGSLSADEYQQYINLLSDALGKSVAGLKETKKEVDLLSVAIDEGARILERSFTQMWDNILSGSEKAFAGMMDGFKTMLAQMVHQATTQVITVQIQQALKGGGVDMGQLGPAVAQFAGVILGSKIGGGGDAATLGSAIGSTAGKIIGTYLFGAIGGAAGSFIGGILGGFLGGMFEKRPTQFRAAGDQRFTGLSGSDQETMLETAFGTTFITTRRAENELIAEIKKGLDEFDSALAGFLDADQIGKITESLTNWNIHMTGEAISMEDLLNSRFANIMTTFSQTIQDFVNDGKDLEDQFARLQIGVAAEDIMGQAPDLFGGRTVAEFLTVVSAFKTGTMTITEAFQTVLTLLDQVGAAVVSLREFADSSLWQDFALMISEADMSLSEAVAGMEGALMDAIAAFDGSPEQLSQIGQMAMLVREGELKLLAEIDALQKGISSNLAKLKDDLLGLTAEPKSGEQLFAEAGALVNMLRDAQTPQEVADLAARFEALIRQMSPEDQMRNQTELLRMVTDFDTQQRLALGEMKQAAMDNAQAMRDLVDVFLLEIGPPLDIVANSNAVAAEALNNISEVDLQGHLNETEEILQGGVDDIAAEVGQIGPVVARAIRQALNGVDYNVNVVVDSRSLVTQ